MGDLIWEWTKRYEYLLIIGEVWRVRPQGNVKMYEYNADTPTTLLEAGIVQQKWAEEMYPEYYFLLLSLIFTLVG